MANVFHTPGVYIQEIATLPASVVPVATAIPAFVGFTEKSDINSGDDALNLVPYRITSMKEYVQHFGGPYRALTATLTTGAVAAFPSYDAEYQMYYSVLSFYTNGGGACYIVSTGKYQTTALPVTNITDTALEAGLDKLLEEDEPTLLVFPDAVGASQAHFNNVMQAALAQANTLQDRFVIMDSWTNAVDSSSLTTIRTGIGTQYLKYGAMYMPLLQLSIVYPDVAVRVDTTGIPLHAAPAPANLEEAIILAEDPVQVELAAALAANIGTIRDNIADFVIITPPSGAIAGVYASVDRERGVWKAPANVSLRGVAKPSLPITDAQQEGMNVSSSTGKSINAIRSFTGKGTLVWGARTLAGNDNEWRYVSVRRLFNMIEESIKEATEFVVFEPNDANTWARVRTMVVNFLTGLWRDGALAGAKPEHAFFVNCGLGSTMTAEDILNGYLIVEIGLAAVRPAEFVILRFSHKVQES